jgi:hypothetical protein
MIFFLIIFALTKFIFSWLCRPAQNNPIAEVAASTISSVRSASPPSPVPPEPLSWEPLLEQLASFLSKACPR